MLEYGADTGRGDYAGRGGLVYHRYAMKAHPLRPEGMSVVIRRVIGGG